MFGGAMVQSWHEWQSGVLAVLQADYRDLFAEIRADDVDWEAWRSLFDEGRTPRSAVDRALLRDL